MNLYGEIIERPILRFNYSSNYAIDYNNRQGLKKFGPYDTLLFNKSEIKCGLIYFEGSENIKKEFIDKISQGENLFDGFNNLFKIQLSFVTEQRIKSESENELKNVLKSIINEDVDLVFFIEKSHRSPLYSLLKSKLLANGITSQVVVESKLSNDAQRPWILENIALASYAKVGGTPWVISNPISKNQLVLGFSRATDGKSYLVGFVVLFTHEGDFLFLNSSAPVIEWDDYIKSLERLITDAIEEYERVKGKPDEIILHFNKRPGKRELEAIEKALKQFNSKINFALIHINEYSNFRIFDTAHRTYIPESRLIVNLSKYEVLMLLDGREGDRRKKIGVPRVLDITLDKRSTYPIEIFPELIRQISDFSYLNWRGFNAKAIPVTINYSHLISRLVVEIGKDNWNQLIASGKLRDKSWFL